MLAVWEIFTDVYEKPAASVIRNYDLTLRHIPQDGYFLSHRHEKLKIVLGLNVLTQSVLCLQFSTSDIMCTLQPDWYLSLE
jgi:hypothetical protein